MNKDLEQFENRLDDWLATQRQAENRTSAWDIDEGKKIKQYHEENCEAREIKERHEKIHSGQIRPRKKNTSSVIVTIILIMIALDILSEVFELTFAFIPIIMVVAIVLATFSAIKKGSK